MRTPPTISPAGGTAVPVAGIVGGNTLTGITELGLPAISTATVVAVVVGGILVFIPSSLGDDDEISVLNEKPTVPPAQALDTNPANTVADDEEALGSDIEDKLKENEKYPLKNRERRNKERREKPSDKKEKEIRQRDNEERKRMTGRGGRDPSPKEEDF